MLKRKLEPFPSVFKPFSLAVLSQGASLAAGRTAGPLIMPAGLDWGNAQARPRGPFCTPSLLRGGSHDTNADRAVYAANNDVSYVGSS